MTFGNAVLSGSYRVFFPSHVDAMQERRGKKPAFQERQMSGSCLKLTSASKLVRWQPWLTTREVLVEK